MYTLWVAGAATSVLGAQAAAVRQRRETHGRATTAAGTADTAADRQQTAATAGAMVLHAHGDRCLDSETL